MSSPSPYDVNLQRFSLNENQIQEIPEQLLTNNVKLKYILLDDNQIQRIPEQLFTNTVNLELIDLHNNQIKAIQKNTFSSLTKLSNLYLPGDSLCLFGLKKTCRKAVNKRNVTFDLSELFHSSFDHSKRLIFSYATLKTRVKKL